MHLDLKLERKRLLNENSTLNKNINILAIDIDFLENFEKYYDFDLKMSSKIIASRLHKKLLSGLNLNDLDEDWENTNKVRRKVKVFIYLRREGERIE